MTLLCLDSEQSLEEFAVALQRETKILRRGLLASSPPRLEPRACLREARCELVDNIRYKAVCLLHGLSRIVDESRLDIGPARAETREIVVAEERLLGRRLNVPGQRAGRLGGGCDFLGRWGAPDAHRCR